MTPRQTAVLLAALVLGGAQPARGQVINPTRVEWQHASADYAATVRYELGWYLGATAEAPVQVSALVPAPTDCTGTATVTCSLPLPARPALGSWIARLRAVALGHGSAEVVSAWSDVSNPFSFSPSAPTQLRVTP